MSNKGRELSAREKRAAEAKAGSKARVSQRAGSSTTTPEVGATAATKSRRPDLERNVVVATDNQPKPLQKRHDETQKKDDGVEKGRNVLEKVRRETSLLETTRDAKLAASRLSQIVSTDVHFPLPEQMAQKDAYSDMALRCMTFLSSLNQLARGYELDARSQTHKLAAAEKARDDYMGEKKDLEKQAKRDIAIKYEDSIGRDNRKIKLINGTLRVNIVLLAKVRSNIELVGLLKKGEVPDLDAELVTLKKQEAGLLSATDEFAFHMGKLEDILKDLSAGGTESRVAEADAVPASSSSGPSGDDDSDSTTGGPP
ncbi:hypothetical protein AALP_AA8G193300 [Arabis alpina]|uniref:Uncharacterized protein n=1 Tax=Arabis alpina TaxID=50452 RepID=A0A087G819_ARAAL|nr:hypothetical protein AALP_AA8G193300 [Arabis alpina]